jgi:hypothetical protein
MRVEMRLKMGLEMINDVVIKAGKIPYEVLKKI